MFHATQIDLSNSVDDRPVTLGALFTLARTYNDWQDKPVSDATLRELYDLVKMAPTSANCSPGRFVFVRSREGKERLSPALSSGNLAKTMKAPVTAIVAYDLEFFEKLPKLFPHVDARPWFTSTPDFARETAFRNSSLQGAYLILAARSLGLSAGPMSGFDNNKLDNAFFARTRWRSNFLVNLGYGDGAHLFPRLPRLSFDEACQLL